MEKIKSQKQELRAAAITAHCEERSKEKMPPEIHALEARG